MALVAAIVFGATYFFMVRTYLGQYVENSALLGAKQSASATQVADALENLDVISYASLAVAAIIFIIIGFVRRSWQIGLAGLGTLGVATVAAEILKRWVFSRPDLAPIYQDNAHNSFPSGHTTIAMSILVALLLVFSYRWRGLMMLVATWWALSVGEATITARWHRLSDTVGADMIALFVGALAALWLLSQGKLVGRREGRYPLRTIFVVLLAVLALLTLASGFLVGVLTLNNFGVFQELAAARASGAPAALTAHLDPQFNENMFLSAQTLAFGFSALSALWFWGTLHRVGSASI